MLRQSLRLTAKLMVLLLLTSPLYASPPPQTRPQAKASSTQAVEATQQAVAAAENDAAAADDEEVVDDSADDDGQLLQSVFGDRVDVGGWLSVAYRDTDLPNSRRYLDAERLYIYARGRLSDTWSSFAEVEFEHSPAISSSGADGEIKLERLYVEYSPDNRFRARIGRFNTRSGIWTPEHWAVSVDTVTKPIHEDNAYVPRKSVGVELSGAVFPRIGNWATEVSYAGYVSNGSENVGTNKPADDSLGVGFDVNVTLQRRVMVGASMYSQNNPSPRLGGTIGRHELSRMLYGELRLPGRVLLRAEHFAQRRDGIDPDVDVLYVKARWNFAPRWYANYRWNRGDDERRAGGAIHTVNTATLAFWPLINVRAKFELSFHRFDDPAMDAYTGTLLHVGYIF